MTSQQRITNLAISLEDESKRVHRAIKAMKYCTDSDLNARTMLIVEDMNKIHNKILS